MVLLIDSEILNFVVSQIWFDLKSLNQILKCGLIRNSPGLSTTNEQQQN